MEPLDPRRPADLLRRLIRPLSALWRRFDRYPLLQFAALALLINFTVELLSRRSLFKAVHYILASPLYFLLSTLIILASLSISLLFRRRTFFLVFVSMVWLGLGVANCVILSFRTIPLGGADFLLLSSVLSVFDAYLDPYQMVLIVVAFLAAGAALVLLWRRSSRRLVRYPTALLAVALLCAGVYGGTSALAVNTTGSSDFANISQAYENFGFVYCFSNSVVDVGIQRPQNYSQGAVEAVTGAIAPQEEGAGEIPNIIFVQLESLFDVGRLEGLTFSQDPLPTLNALRETCAHGLLTVPYVGSGTANTEFEVLTGMSLDYFGPCEYPYRTVLQSAACETIATNLGELGLSAHAIHNNTATFYQRNRVYGALGFDTFTSLEYMNGVDYTIQGWAKDGALVQPILDALASTEGQDFVFTVSVQPHGKYPTSRQEGVDYPISVTGCETEEEQAAMEYYAAQLRETDAFVARLLEALEGLEEDVVVVLYGDHLPELGIGEEDLSSGTCYQTEYIIWSNCGLPAVERDLTAYQLSAYVLDLVDVHTGVINQLHQAWDFPAESQGQEDDPYQEALCLLSYDMLYGAHFFSGGASPYAIEPVTFGVREVVLTGAEACGEGLLISGENFTPFSQAAVNGDPVETFFLSPTSLCISLDRLPEGEDCQLSVVQVSQSGAEILSESAPILFSSLG